MKDANRVLIIQPALPKYRIPVFKELASRPGIDLTVLYATPKAINNVKPEGFNVLQSVDKTFNTPIGPLFLNKDHLKYVSKKHFDTVIITGNPRYLLLIPTIIKARLNGLRCILWTHGCSKKKGNIRKWLRERVYTLSHGIVFYSNTVRQKYIQSGWDKNRLFVAPNSIDYQPIYDAIDYWDEHVDELHQFQEQESLTKQQNIIFISRFTPKNKLDLLIKAAGDLVSQGYKNLQIILIGGGDDTVLNDLEKLAEELKVSEHIKFTGPIYNEQEIAKWMLSSQIFCYPCNMGLSVQHAMVYKLPVVTSNKTRLHGPEIELIENNHTGVFFEHGSYEDLRDKLKNLIDNSEQRNSIAMNAHDLLNSKYGISNMVNGMERCIKNQPN